MSFRAQRRREGAASALDGDSDKDLLMSFGKGDEVTNARFQLFGGQSSMIAMVVSSAMILWISFCVSATVALKRL